MRAPEDAEAALLARARGLAGRPLASVAAALDRAVPPDLRRAKGWVGRLVEDALGAAAGTAAAPDFPELGVELKTLPVVDGRAIGSTFVCRAPLAELARGRWADSRVRKKLARVLWVPVEAGPDTPIAARRLGTPLLWSPSPEEEAALRADWEALAQLVAEGWVELATAERGEWLQLRPKGRRAASRQRGVVEGGVPGLGPTRGFYLRRRFTQRLVERHWAVTSDRPARSRPR
jgi:DNA mismatch repair protein MutH